MLVVAAVPELPGHGEAVLPVALLGQGIPGGWCPVEEGYLVGSVVDALPEHVDDAPVAYLTL